MSIQKSIPKPKPPEGVVITTTSGIQISIGADALRPSKTEYAVQEMQKGLSKDQPSDILLDESATNSAESEK